MSAQSSLGNFVVVGGASVTARPAVAAAAAAGAGFRLEGGTSGAGANLDAGALVLASGASTGTGAARVGVQVADRGAAGAVANILRDRLIIPSARTMATGSGVRTALFSIAVPVGGMAAAHVDWSVQAWHTNGTDLCVTAGRSVLTAANASGVATGGTADGTSQSTMTVALGSLGVASSAVAAGGAVSFGLAPTLVLFPAAAVRAEFVVHLTGNGTLTLA
jgi:hypothetical protein